ncbi:uncharacterized protein LOC119670544 [Teleopsis dalmanni]|uniref:uncharacterized protein LOC119670544 n=1 Tax=Teleopsis dalmanni TaxID=139649 RepID=UPI0018CF1A2F|nr:uncharacterized protein LOC119670544 [Teleopsis dalmanni]XP_037936779.1 uncharacterized protein LOC119670544 [Teleopsis dalmanni]
MLPQNNQILSVKEEALAMHQAVHAIGGEAIIVTTQDFRTVIDSRNISYSKVLPNGQKVQLENQLLTPNIHVGNAVNPNALSQQLLNHNSINPNTVLNVTPIGLTQLNAMKTTIPQLLGNANQLGNVKSLFPTNFSKGTNTGF